MSAANRVFASGEFKAATNAAFSLAITSAPGDSAIDQQAAQNAALTSGFMSQICLLKRDFQQPNVTSCSTHKQPFDVLTFQLKVDFQA